MERLIRGAENIAKQLGISARTLKRRLENQWKDGFGFFKDECGFWCIRESNLEHLISAMEHGWLRKKGTLKQEDTER